MDDARYIRIVTDTTDLIVDRVGGLDRIESSSLQGLWQRHHETIELLLAEKSDEDLQGIMRAFESDLLHELATEMPATGDPRTRLVFFAAASVAKELFRRTNATSRKRTIGGLPPVATPAAIPMPPQEAPFVLTSPTAPTQGVKRAPPRHETVEPMVVILKAHGGPGTRLLNAVTDEQKRDAWRYTGKFVGMGFLFMAAIISDALALVYLFKQVGPYIGGLLILFPFVLEGYGLWRLAKYLGLLDE
jgi:hypothetical protein